MENFILTVSSSSQEEMKDCKGSSLPARRKQISRELPPGIFAAFEAARREESKRCPSATELASVPGLDEVTASSIKHSAAPGLSASNQTKGISHDARCLHRQEDWVAQHR